MIERQAGPLTAHLSIEGDSMLNGFKPEVQEKLIRFFENHRNSQDRKIAVFDADGTLWRGDVGEEFFKYQIHKGLVPKAPPTNPWEVYFKSSQSELTAAQAYGWLAQWNAGVHEEDLKNWARDFFKAEFYENIFGPMQQWVRLLQDAKFEVWVVSGSIRWVVAAGASHYGIPEDRILGTSVHVESGQLSDRIENEVPYRAGKHRLIQKIIGTKPLFAAGNTYWDKEMLESATDLALAIHSEGEQGPNYQSEQKLKKLAEANLWLIQRF